MLSNNIILKNLNNSEQYLNKILQILNSFAVLGDRKKVIKEIGGQLENVKPLSRKLLAILSSVELKSKQNFPALQTRINKINVNISTEELTSIISELLKLKQNIVDMKHGLQLPQVEVTQVVQRHPNVEVTQTDLEKGKDLEDEIESNIGELSEAKDHVNLLYGEAHDKQIKAVQTFKGIEVKGKLKENLNKATENLSAEILKLNLLKSEIKREILLYKIDEKIVLRLSYDSDNQLEIKCKKNFNGNITIQRLDEKNELIPGIFDVIRIQNGESIDMVVGDPSPTKENSRMFNICDKFCKKENITDPNQIYIRENSTYVKDIIGKYTAQLAKEQIAAPIVGQTTSAA